MYDSKVLIEYSSDMEDIYKNIEEYNPNKKRKILIALDDMVADMLSNKKCNPMVTELFIRGRKLNISLFYYTILFRLNSTHYCIMKIPNQLELQQIGFNHSSDTDLQVFATLYENVLQNHIIFWLLILLLHGIILHVSERIF